MDYHLRVDTDLSNENLTLFFSDSVKLYGRQFEKTIVSREAKKDGTIHIHAYCRLVIPVTTFRSRVKAFFKVTQASYSVSKKRKDSLFSYVVKDKDVVLFTGFTKEEIETFKSESYQKYSKKEGKKSTIMAKLLAVFKEKYSDVDFSRIEKYDYFKTIYEYYIKELLIVPSDFKLKDMVTTLEILYCIEIFGNEDSHYRDLMKHKFAMIYNHAF